MIISENSHLAEGDLVMDPLHHQVFAVVGVEINEHKPFYYIQECWESNEPKGKIYKIHRHILIDQEWRIVVDEPVKVA